MTDDLLIESLTARAEAAEARVKQLEGANAALRAANDMLLRAVMNTGGDNAG